MEDKYIRKEELHASNMEHTIRKIVFFLTLLILQFHAIGQIFNPSLLGGKIFSSFKAKDFETYKHLLIDSTDYNEFLKDYFKNDFIAKSFKKDSSMKEPGFPDSIELQQREEFIRLIGEGERLGIEWSKIENPDFIYKENEKTGSDIKSISGYLKFIFNGKEYMIFGIESSLFSSGYKIYVILTVMDFKVKR